MPQIVRRPPAVVPVTLAAIVLALAFCGPAAAQTFDLVALPAQPNVLDEVTLVVTVVSGNTYSLGDVVSDVVGNLTISVDYDGPCLVTCPDTEQTFEVPLGRLNAGYYHVDLVSEGLLRAELLFKVVEEVDHALGPSLQIHPEAPTDNDRLWATIPWTTAPCIYGGVTLDRIEVAEGEQTLVVRTGRTTNPPPCPPTEPTTSSLLIDLGQVEPGDLKIRLLLEEQVDNGPFGDAVPIVTVTVPIGDADDAVDLLDRYRVRATWTTPLGESGPARPVPDPTRESALFTFFDVSNWEVMVKVLDACAINGHRWVVLTLASDLEVDLEIVDLDTPDSAPWTFLQPQGMLSPTVIDVEAFACSP
ncbi:MAG: hypothetical protein AAGE94_05975 [Acidobacteriota bacterium]